MDFTGLIGFTCSLLLLSVLDCVQGVYHGPTEYCQWEQFTAKCAEDEMILFRNAVYGRMRLGRCVTRDFGFLGCGTDVLPTMHRVCSGRHQCEFGVTNLHGTHDCSKDLTAYLAASYECVKVVNCEKKMCETSDYLKVASTSGYLSSEVTFESGCGTASCPWVIHAQPGQRINLTLLDFTAGHNVNTGSDPRKVCYRYATVKEANTITRDITICVGEEASEINHVYMSETETISIILYTADKVEELFYYALKYEVLGCPTLTPPTNAWMKRTGDTVTVYCNATKREWHLRCTGTSWIGEVGACEEDLVIQPLIEGESAAFGMLVIIGMGVAIGVIIGGLLLAITLLYLKRRTRPQEVRTNPLLGENGIYGERVPRYDDDQKPKNTITLSIKQENGGHDYTCTLPYRGTQIGRDPRSPRRGETCISAGDSGVASVDFPPLPDFGHTRDQPHVYESPTFPLQPVPMRGNRTQSVDGISRKTPCEEFSSNRTN